MSTPQQPVKPAQQPVKSTPPQTGKPPQQPLGTPANPVAPQQAKP
ncbi:MAG TPA: hypothetical protein VE988_24605 [Gemmataceae bacterium]|nr:hypothetical protein [Gemmataceae bacterium]